VTVSLKTYNTGEHLRLNDGLEAHCPDIKPDTQLSIFNPFAQIKTIISYRDFLENLGDMELQYARAVQDFNYKIGLI
jgi:hypothetical protein